MRNRVTTPHFERAKIKYDAMLRSIVRKLLPPKHLRNAGTMNLTDLMVEAHKELLYAMIHYDRQRASFRTYMFAHIKSRLLALTRRYTRQARKIRLVDNDFIAEAYTARNADPDHRLLVEDVTRCLGEIEKRVVLDTYIRSKPSRLIADELGVTHDTVRNILSRAKARLRERFPELVVRRPQETAVEAA